jgi:crotonobetaine/carnitine-CoA ligase
MAQNAEYQSIGVHVFERATKWGNRRFAWCEDGELTYAAAGQYAARVGGGLRELGVAEGDRICMMLDNGIRFFQAWFGIHQLGAVAVPLNTAARGDLLAHVLNDSGARVLIIEAGLADRLLLIEKSLLHLRHIVIVDPAGSSETDVKRFHTLRFTDLLDGQVIPPASRDDRSVAAVLYTSGTTGPSKGALLCHRGLLAFVTNHTRYCGIRSDTVCHTNLPLFHAIALVLSAHGALSVGASVAVSKRFSASRFWDEIRATGAEYTSITGSIAQILFKQAPTAGDRDHRLRTIYAVPAPSAIYQQFEERFGARFVEAYGATDGQIVTYTPRDNVRPGSCGKVIDGFELAIVDDGDEPQPPGVTGEIVYRSKAPYVMSLGYHNNADATVETRRNFWFHSGDYGYLDKDGFLFFVDRKKDALRRRGENVSSYEVEKVFNDHEAVSECAAVAVPSELNEDEIKIVISLKPEAKVEALDLIKWSEPRLPYFMIPRYVEFMDELPKTANGKVMRFELRKSGIVGCWDLEKSGYTLRR